MLNMKSVFYFWIWKNKLVPALIVENEPSTAQLKFLERTYSCIYWALWEYFHEKQFFKENSPFMEYLTKNLKTKSYSYTTLKNKTKDFFLKQLEKLIHLITVENVAGIINLDEMLFFNLIFLSCICTLLFTESFMTVSLPCFFFQNKLSSTMLGWQRW